MTPRAAKRLLLVSLIVIFTATGGAAYGYFSATGSGNASGSNATTSPVTLSPGSPSANLYPGGLSSVVLTVSNPNATAVRIGSLTLDTSKGTAGYSVDAGHPACPTTTFSFTTQTNSGAGWTVPPKSGSVNGSLSITLANALTMSVNAANACQGATATVYLMVAP